MFNNIKKGCCHTLKLKCSLKDVLGSTLANMGMMNVSSDLKRGVQLICLHLLNFSSMNIYHIIISFGQFGLLQIIPATKMRSIEPCCKSDHIAK